MNTITYKCPNCDGGLIFDPGEQKFKCEYCLTEFTEEELLSKLNPDAAKMADESAEEVRTAGKDTAGKGTAGKDTAGRETAGKDTAGKDTAGRDTAKENIAQESAAEGIADSGESTSDTKDGGAFPGPKYGGEPMAVYSCPSCGAEIVAGETTAAAYCYYCHNPVVLSGRLGGEYRPDCVVPFTMDKKTAEQIFKTWISRKRYIPKDFYSPRQIELLEGIYFPYWMYSCRIEGSIAAEAVKRRVSRLGSVENIETSYYKVNREGGMDVKHVARNALKKADRRLAEAVLPYDMEKTRPFTAAYLSGFRAERRDVDSEELRIAVETEVRDYAVEALRNGITGYDSVRVIKHEEKLGSPKWEYALLPVWVLTYSGKRDGKTYYFAMNGQSGKICGVLPVDYKRLTVLFAAIFLPLLFLFLLGGYLL